MKNLADHGWPWYALERYWEEGKEDLGTVWSFALGEIEVDAFLKDSKGFHIPHLQEYRQSIIGILSGMTEEERAEWLMRMTARTAYEKKYEIKIT